MTTLRTDPAPETGVRHQVADFLAKAEPDQFLVYYGDEQWNASQLRAAVAALDVAFKPDAGVLPLTLRVAAVMRNHPWHVATLTAVLSGGHTLVLLSSLEPPPRTVADIRELRPHVLIGERGDLSPELLAAAREVGARLVWLPAPGERAAIEVAGALPPGDDAEAGVAVLMLTSGTTGPAKRVPISYKDLDSALTGAEQHYVGKRISGRRRQPVICPLMPVTISGLWSLITGLAGGAPVALLDRFEVELWARAVEQHRPRTVNLPPPALRMILEAGVTADRLSSITSVWSAAAPLDPELAVAFEQTYRIPVLQSYGATEFTGGLAGWSLTDWQRSGDEKRGSVGRLHPGVECRVLHPETQQPVPTGETGMLSFRTPHSVGVGADEWVRTNDVGRIDKDGFLFIDGRADDVINRGGFKVSASKLKAVLESHPGVREAAVVPVSDTRLGSAPGALIVPVGQAPTVAELEAHVREQLPPYYVPTIWGFADDLPRNGAMKIVRPAVVDKLLEGSNE